MHAPDHPRRSFLTLGLVGDAGVTYLRNIRTMRLIINLVLISLMTFSSVALASDQDRCKFMKEATQQIEFDPDNLAESNFKGNKILFYSVGAGFAGVIPCFENNEEFDCANNLYRIELIWVGGDVISCEGQSELGNKVRDWAGKFNCRMKSLLIESNQYKCGTQQSAVGGLALLAAKPHVQRETK